MSGGHRDARRFRVGSSWGGGTSLAVPRGDEPNRPDTRCDQRLARPAIGSEEPQDRSAELQRALA